MDNKDLPFWELLLSDTSQESGVASTSADPPGSSSANTTQVCEASGLVPALEDPPTIIASNTTPEDMEYYDESKTAAENLTNILQLMQEDQQAYEANWGTVPTTSLDFTAENTSVEAPRLWSPLPEYE